MLVGKTRASFLSAAVLVGGAAIACGANTLSSGAAVSSSEPACPASFGDVATATCHLEGQACTYLVSCATFPSNAVCTCTGGAFACSGYGDAGTACVALATTGKCPLSERAADGLFCSDLGLICPYPSPCSAIPAYDSCQCVGGRTADEQPHYECTSACETDAAGVPDQSDASDASVPDAEAPADAKGPDAPTPPTDAASQDATD